MSGLEASDFRSYVKAKNDPAGLSSSLFLDEKEIIDVDKMEFLDDENWLKPSHSKTDLHQWMYGSIHDYVASSPYMKQNIDTRTFTRPKKRFTRPSIEKYNEELYGEKEHFDNGIQQNGNASSGQPLHFDLEQMTTSAYFENLANAPMVDSFLNMSPPSLVNSMCSSTFANLMESSCIKNDPELRQIKDTDFTEIVIQNESAPTFYSLEESFESLGCDSLLRKSGLKEKNGLGKVTTDPNATFIKEDSFGEETNTNTLIGSPPVDLNVTFRRVSPPQSPVNTHVQRTKGIEKTTNHNKNATITLQEKSAILEGVRRLLNRRPSPDLNRLSYIVGDGKKNETYKRKSFGSVDSGENMDCMSLSSGSSRESSKMEGLNAVMTPRRAAFLQLVSTPMVGGKRATFELDQMSPIVDCSSDPELSCSELQMPEPIIHKPRSVGNLRKLIRASKQSHAPPQKSPHGVKNATNLNLMGHRLKGSYTSLRPTNVNLPVAPPPLETLAKSPIAQVSPQVRESPKAQVPASRSQPPRSNLPRPVTGIPRPVSRIPGPKNAKPVAKSAGAQGRH